MKANTRDLLIILFLLTLFSVNCFSAIPPEQKNLDIHEVLEAMPQPLITESQVAAIVPTDIPAGATNGTVGKMVLDKALKSALKSDFIKSSSVGQTADSLKDGLNTEMAIGGDPTDPTSIKHKFKVKVDPIQERAKLQYSGYVDASASYDKGAAVFEINEHFDMYTLNISHTSNQTEDLSLVQLQWAW